MLFDQCGVFGGVLKLVVWLRCKFLLPNVLQGAYSFLLPVQLCQALLHFSSLFIKTVVVPLSAFLMLISKFSLNSLIALRSG